MVLLQQSQQLLKGNSFKDHLQTLAQDIEAELGKILPPPTSRLHETMRYSVLGGGKRIRPFLCVASSQIFDVPRPLALKTAAALEIIHAYSLVHDDLPCMDDADLRRGKASCHKAYGEATATLVGDALIPLSFQVLTSLETSPSIRIDLIQELSEVIGSSGLVAGQMRDLGQEGPQQTFEELLDLQKLKTGVLFGFAAQAGAILGNASSPEKEALKSYGLLVGEAFQMIDDWLDGWGNEELTGKPKGQDIRKSTFLSLLGPQLLMEQAKSTIEKAIEGIEPFKEKASLLREAALFTLTFIETSEQ